MHNNREITKSQLEALAGYRPMRGWPRSLPWPLDHKAVKLALSQLYARNDGSQHRYESAVAGKADLHDGK
jgi:hypothetical protein